MGTGNTWRAAGKKILRRSSSSLPFDNEPIPFFPLSIPSMEKYLTQSSQELQVTLYNPVISKFGYRKKILELLFIFIFHIIAF